MMSLFSSFDWMIFSGIFPTLLICLVLILGQYFFLSSVRLNLSKMVCILSDFFYSLKPKMFNKTSSLAFFCLIMGIASMNFLSVFSFNFPFTSQFSAVMFMSLVLWSSFMIFNFTKNYKAAISHFIPEGSPVYLSSILFLIEIVSSIIRPITLSVRLVANILAGHLLMILLSSLVLNLKMLLPLYMLLNLVEIFVALIQSYIYCTMLVLYFSELH